MQEDDVATLLREAMMVTLVICGPPLLAALAVGMVVSLLQAATQINEQTLAFLPKVAAIGVTLVVLGTFMITSLNGFTLSLFDRLVAVGGR